MERSIAWIEDDTHIIEPVVRPLEEAGYRISKFSNAQAALDAAEEIAKHDLLLLDIIIPQGNPELELGRFPGVALLRELQEKRRLAIPVLVLTVVDREEAIEALKKLDVEEVLNKPILSSELKDAVERILTSRNA